MAEVRPTGSRAVAGAAALYGVLVVAAILFLVPFYLLVRNGLSTDLEISRAGLEVLPIVAAVRQRHRPVRQPVGAVPAQPAQLGDRRRAPDDRGRARRLDGRLRPGPHSVPVRQRRVRHDPRDADDPGSGDVRAELHHRLRDRLAEHVPGADRAGDVPGVRPRSCSASTSSAFRSSSRRRARIDGLSTWGTYWRIVVPNSKGIFAAVASITFIGSWNAFLWPLVVVEDRSDGRCRWPCRRSSTRRARR